MADLSLTFDGSGDYALYPNLGVTGAVTVLALVNLANVTGWHSIVGGNTTGGAISRWNLETDATRLNFNTNASGGASMTGAATTGWRMYGVSDQVGATAGQTMLFWGNLATKALSTFTGSTPQANPSTANETRVGQWQTTDDMAGQIALIAVWVGTALTSTQIQGILDAQTTASILALSPTWVIDASDGLTNDLVGTRHRTSLGGNCTTSSAVPSGWVFGSGGSGPALYTVSASDAVAASDAATRAALSGIRTTADTASATDAATRTSARGRTTGDTAVASDAATRGGVLLPRASPDSASASDAAARGALSRLRSTTDSAPSSDVATRSALALGRTGSDSSPVSDAGTRAALLRARSSSDSISGISDLALIGGAISRTGSDSATVSDVASRAPYLRSRASADSAPSSEAISRRDIYARTAGDTASASDLASRAARSFRTAVEVLPAASDAASGSVAGHPTEYRGRAVGVIDEAPYVAVVGVPVFAGIVTEPPALVGIPAELQYAGVVQEAPAYMAQPTSSNLTGVVTQTPDLYGKVK